MIALALAAAIAAAPVTPAREPPPELWRGARVGMTRLQVQTLFPQGHPAAGSTVDLNKATSVAGFAMDEQVYGRPGVATFYFRGDALSEVVVELKDIKSHHTSENFEQARDISTSLSTYYGKPSTCVDTSRRGLNRLDCRWLTKGVQVGLSYQDFGGASAAMDIAVHLTPPKPPNPGAVFGHRARRG